MTEPNDAPNGLYTIAGSTTISRQLLEQGRSFHDALMEAILHPPSREQLAAQRAEREAEWDDRTADGLVGVSDGAGYEEGRPYWQRAERGEYVQKWVPEDVWAQYRHAERMLSEAEAALEAW